MWGCGAKPQIMSKNTLDYSNNKSRSAFDTSELFKSSKGGGGLVMGHSV